MAENLKPLGGIDYAVSELEEAAVSFILAVVLFVVIVGALDARLPWPDPKSKEA